MKTRTEYQQHLLEEYASYLRKAIANRTENYTFTPQQLAAALLKAFEKGVMRGILYESQNDIEKEKPFVEQPVERKQPEMRKDQPRKEMSKEEVDKNVDEALMQIANIFAKALSQR